MLDERTLEQVATRRSPPGAHLEVIGGPEDGRTCPLRVGVTRIGRHADNHLDLTLDAAVSPNHARVEWRDGRYYLADSGGHNATTVDGKPITGLVQLEAGQIIGVGHTKLMFRDGRTDGVGSLERE